MKKIIKNLLILIIVSFFSVNVFSQDFEPCDESDPNVRCYTIKRKLDYLEAMNFKSNSKNYGIKVKAGNSSDWKVIVEVKATAVNNILKYESGWGVPCVHNQTDPLYYIGFQTTRNDNNPDEYVNNEIILDGSVNEPKVAWRLRPKFLCFKKEIEVTNSYDLFNDNAWAIACATFGESNKTLYSEGFTTLRGVNNPLMEISIKITGGLPKGEIKSIKIPGIKEIVPEDFYKYPCETDPTVPGCQALADWNNTSNDENKKPIVIPHRGFHGMRGIPEYSLAAVENGWNNKYRYQEVDVRQTKDDIPILFHDEYLGYGTDFGVINNDDISTKTEEVKWDVIKNLKYRTRYWDQNYNVVPIEPTTHQANIHVRLGKVSDFKMNSLSEALDFIKDKDMLLFLDIKSAPTERNLQVLKQAILEAAKKNVLHQIVMKAVRTNAGAPPANQLNITVNNVKDALGEVYTKYKPYINVHVVDYRPDEPSFINDWIAEGNVVGFEFDPNVPVPPDERRTTQNTLFASFPFSAKVFENNTLSPWEYTKSKGYRTGIWSSGLIDPRGRPGHDPSKWNAGGFVQIFSSTDRYKDSRARMEVLNQISPQYITQDRPDVWVKYFRAFNNLNENTFMP